MLTKKNGKNAEQATGTSLVRRTPAGGRLSLASPFTFMRRFAEQMDRLFEDFGFGRGALTPFDSSLSRDLWAEFEPIVWYPDIEVLERDGKLLVRADLPGLSRDDVHVTVEPGLLTIEGERRRETEDRGEGYYRSERSYGRFRREIALPDGIDPDKGEAKFRDGVLEVTFPAPEREQRGRTIEVR